MMSHPFPSRAVGPSAAGIGPGLGSPPPRGGSRRNLLIVTVIGAAVIAVFIAGAAGVYVGPTLAGGTMTPTQAAAASPPRAATPAPTGGEIHEQTVDLCSRFVAGYQAMPAPQNNGFDIIPTINYIADALRDNPLANNEIRDAIGASLKNLRAHAMLLSHEADHGAIQNPTGWNLGDAAHADQRVWDLCKAYGG